MFTLSLTINRMNIGMNGYQINHMAVYDTES